MVGGVHQHYQSVYHLAINYPLCDVLFVSITANFPFLVFSTEVNRSRQCNKTHYKICIQRECKKLIGDIEYGVGTVCEWHGRTTTDLSHLKSFKADL